MTSLQSEFKSLMNRCMALHGRSYEVADDGTLAVVPTDTAVRNFLTTLCNDSKDHKEVAERIKAAWNDPQAQLALNAARIWQVGNFIAAESTFRSAFFEIVTLRPDEEPWVQNETKNEVRVGSISEDGTPETVRVLKADSKFALGLYMIASDYVKYRTLDLYKGDITGPQKATFDIARDLTFKLDRLHYSLLTAALADGGCFGAFVTEQGKANRAQRIYMPHSGIVVAHLPTTNDFDNAAVQAWDTEQNLTGFRPAVIKVIEAYANRWGNALPDNAGRLVPTGEIIVPASDLENLGKYLAVSNNTVASDLQNQVEKNGFASLTFWNRTWRFIPDVTIVSGTCYPRFNLPVGLSFDKPSHGGEDVQTNKLEHWEKRAQSRAWGAAILSQWRVRACRIKYIA
jgi:hypothetical protein